MLSLFVAACGDDTDTSSSSGSDGSVAPSETSGSEPGDVADDTGDVDDDQGADTEAGASGDFGSATVAGTTYGFERALRCDPDSLGVEGITSEIEAQFLGSADGGRIQLDIMTSELAGMPMHSVSWAGPEGIFGATFTQVGDSWMGEGDDTYQDAPIVISGDRATGSVVLYDSFTMEDALDLDFDVTIPSETFACR